MLNFFLTVNKNFPKISRELKKFPENFPGFPGNQTNPILQYILRYGFFVDDNMSYVVYED